MGNKKWQHITLVSKVYCCAACGAHLAQYKVGRHGMLQEFQRLEKTCDVMSPRINKPWFIRGYSPNSHDLILQWYLPNSTAVNGVYSSRVISWGPTLHQLSWKARSLMASGMWMDRIIWGWVKTLVPSEPQNSWDLWMFIPLKMYL